MVTSLLITNGNKFLIATPFQSKSYQIQRIALGARRKRLSKDHNSATEPDWLKSITYFEGDGLLLKSSN